MSAQERIESRFAAILTILIGVARESGTPSTAGVLHLITTGEASALAHVDLLGRLCAALGITVARLSSDDAEATRAAAYRADVVIGTLTDFAADLERDTALGITRCAVMVENGPSAAPSVVEHQLLTKYRRVHPA
jgi:hypothetical protein